MRDYDYDESEAEARETRRRMIAGNLIILFLIICLAITSIALLYSSVQLSGNTIKTGYIAISLNGGKPVISSDGMIFEPGETVTKEFYLTNTSTTPVWYRFYFDNVEGMLQNVVQVTIREGDEVLYTGTVAELDEDYSKTAPEDQTELAINETRILTIEFSLPKNTSDALQGCGLAFDFVAEAVQSTNNPNRLFNN